MQGKEVIRSNPGKIRSESCQNFATELDFTCKTLVAISMANVPVLAAIGTSKLSAEDPNRERPRTHFAPYFSDKSPPSGCIAM